MNRQAALADSSSQLRALFDLACEMMPAHGRTMHSCRVLARMQACSRRMDKQSMANQKACVPCHDLSFLPCLAGLGRGAVRAQKIACMCSKVYSSNTTCTCPGVLHAVTPPAVPPASISTAVRLSM
jgi:hypothetical protein